MNHIAFEYASIMSWACKSIVTRTR